MSFYMKYTIRRSVPVVTTYRCSSCGARNDHKQALTVEASYTDRGAFTKKKIDKRKHGAEKELEADTADVLQSASEITGESDFYRFNFKGRCRSCGHREPWSIIRLKGLDIASTLCGCVALIELALILMRWKDNGSLLAVPVRMYVIFGVCVLGFLSKYIWKLIQKSKISKLPPESLPKVITDAEELRERLSQDDGAPPEDEADEVT